ncbi:hypothetical protein ACIP69_18340 [Streptomyces hygroscopicus]|uniref:hypothetical protein n=1 Tax=Streptomyces hygroscopicus TaxID=1912 RepID=UPI0037F8F94D
MTRLIRNASRKDAKRMLGESHPTHHGKPMLGGEAPGDVKGIYHCREQGCPVMVDDHPRPADLENSERISD